LSLHTYTHTQTPFFASFPPSAIPPSGRKSNFDHRFHFCSSLPLH
jgi:hypothetical protein